RRRTSGRPSIRSCVRWSPGSRGAGAISTSPRADRARRAGERGCPHAIRFIRAFSMASRERPVARCDGRPAVGGDARSPVDGRAPVGAFSTPLGSSAERPGWERVLVEVHRMPPGEGEVRVPQLMISLTLEPARLVTARLEGGRARSATGAAGGLFIVPPGASHWCAWDRNTAFLALYITPEALVQTVHDEGL